MGLDYGTPTINLAGQSLKFENGQWMAGGCHPHCLGQWLFGGKAPACGLTVLLPPESGVSGGVDRREAQRLRRRNQQLEEENNLLKLKVDILLDMVRGPTGGNSGEHSSQLTVQHCARALRGGHHQHKAGQSLRQAVGNRGRPEDMLKASRKNQLQVCPLRSRHS